MLGGVRHAPARMTSEVYDSFIDPDNLARRDGDRQARVTLPVASRTKTGRPWTPHSRHQSTEEARRANWPAGRNSFFKCENLQRAGALEFRGATNAVLKLSGETARRGVVTQSSGNHGQAHALAARLCR